MLIGIPLGCIAIKSARKVNNLQWPISFKLLLTGVLFIFIIGTIGIIDELAWIFKIIVDKKVGPATGFGIGERFRHTCYLIQTMMWGCLEYLLFFTASLIIIHNKQKDLFKNKEIHNKEGLGGQRPAAPDFRSSQKKSNNA